MTRSLEKKVLTLSQQRMWQNWATVEELSEKWKVSKRRVQQILKELGLLVDRGHLITIEGMDHFVSIRPIFRFLGHR